MSIDISEERIERAAAHIAVCVKCYSPAACIKRHGKTCSCMRAARAALEADAPYAAAAARQLDAVTADFAKLDGVLHATWSSRSSD